MSDAFRTRAGAVALVAAPALTLVAHLVQATPTRHDTASELASIAAHPARYQFSGLLGFVSLVLFVPALLTMASPLWERRPRVAMVGLAMSITGLMALASLMGSGPVSLAMARAAGGDRAVMVELTDRYESSWLVLVWVLLMIVGWSIGPVVLGVALWRSGFPAAVPVLLAGAVVLAVLDAGRWPLAAGFALTCAGMALVAVRVWPRPLARDAAGERRRVSV
jgi:hypothetical protein